MVTTPYILHGTLLFTKDFNVSPQLVFRITLSYFNVVALKRLFPFYRQETETQRGCVACPRLHLQDLVEPQVLPVPSLVFSPLPVRLFKWVSHTQRCEGELSGSS